MPAPLKHLLECHLDIFAEGNGLGSMRDASHQIKLKPDVQLIRMAPRRVSPTIASEMRKQVHEMLEQGVIAESQSPWAAPVTLVRKKDQTYRFCVDYRALNKVTVSDAFPMPHIDTILDGLRGATVFSSLDCASGYWQLPVDKESQQMTAFCTPDGLYECLKMPFGLKTAPASFSRSMNGILAPFIGKFVFVYLDDLLVFSSSLPDHVEHLRLVFDAIRNANLRLKGQKCRFCVDELPFLGYTVSTRGIHPDPEKVCAIKHGRNLPVSNSSEVFWDS